MNDYGNPVNNKSFNKYLTKMCKIANILRITSHAFRHAKTELLVLAGNDIIYTQKQLGHSDPSVTLKYYSSLNDDIRNKNKQFQEDFLRNIK
ncbi:tyrosine-type recombinase/integrase [Erwinia sp. CPCC 100877]|nr:tyrosine-type recombinase/integrase [Erwinia sp. CPCC 100877]